MKNYAVQLSKFGSLDNLNFEQFDFPKIDDEEIIISVHCCGISFADILVVEGKYQDNPAIPFVPGVEVSGVVMEVGKKIKDLNDLYKSGVLTKEEFTKAKKKILN